MRIHDAVNKPNFGIQYDTCHGQMVGVDRRASGRREGRLSQRRWTTSGCSHGRINHIHLIDSDNTCHKDANGNDETSAHPPFGLGVLNFDEIVPELVKAARLSHDWWTIDLCFWPDAWAATETCKTATGRADRRSTANVQETNQMAKELRVGMIGYGFMGRAHSNAYKRLNDFFPVQHRPVLKAACARNEEKAQAFAEQLGL